MKSFYSFYNLLKDKYNYTNITYSALYYEQSYDKIILNNIYDTKQGIKKCKTTNLTLSELRSYFLECDYCLQIYLTKFPNLSSLLNDFKYEFNGLTFTLLELRSFIRLLPYTGLDSSIISSNIYNYINTIKPYYYEVTKLYVNDSI